MKWLQLAGWDGLTGVLAPTVHIGRERPLILGLPLGSCPSESKIAEDSISGARFLCPESELSDDIKK